MLFRHQKHISAIGYLPQSRDYPKIFSFPAKPFLKLASIAKNAIFHSTPKPSYSKIRCLKLKGKYVSSQIVAKIKKHVPQRNIFSIPLQNNLKSKMSAALYLVFQRLTKIGFFIFPNVF